MRQKQWKTLEKAFYDWMFALSGSVGALGATHGMGEGWADALSRSPEGRRSLAAILTLATQYGMQAVDFYMQGRAIRDATREMEDSEQESGDDREPEEIVVDELMAHGLSGSLEPVDADEEDVETAEEQDSGPTSFAVATGPVPATVSAPTPASEEVVGTVDEVLGDVGGGIATTTSAIGPPLFFASMAPEIGRPARPSVPSEAVHPTRSGPTREPKIFNRPRETGRGTTHHTARVVEGHPGPSEAPIPYEPHPRSEPRKTVGRTGRQTRLAGLPSDPNVPDWIREYMRRQIKTDPTGHYHLPRAGERGPDGRPLTEDYVLGHVEHERHPVTGEVIHEGKPARENHPYDTAMPIPRSQNVHEERMRLAGESRERIFFEKLGSRLQRQLAQGRFEAARKTVLKLLEHNVRLENIPRHLLEGFGDQPRL
jgi:hypothetical protein